MPFAMLEGPRCFVRQELLGSEAVYEIVEVGEQTVTAEVIFAPGLPPGKRVRLLVAAARATVSYTHLTLPTTERV